MDSYGRIFYIDHKNHTTTWQKPNLDTPNQNNTDPVCGSNSFSNATDPHVRVKHQQERQQLDRRYQCIRKSIARNASMFLHDPNSNDITPASTTITVDRQRELLMKVS